MKKLTVNSILELLCAVILLGTLLYVVCMYSRIPEIIPTHYNFEGRVDDYGSKNIVWMLFFFELFTYGILSFAQGNPKFCNYPVQVTESNKDKLYFLGKRLLVLMKLCTIILFSYIALAVLALWDLNLCILYGTIALTLVLPVIFIIKMTKCKG